MEKLLKPYEPRDTESRIYAQWEHSGYFNPDNLPTKNEKPFTIIMPPPNANGHLHAGHALFITLEDIMIRFKRMRGYRALWVPGADHAGFETQIVYERKLEKEGRSRFTMDPQDLYKEILAFTLENKTYMEEEVKRIGASCDWSREKFTLDPDVVKEVQKTFAKMYNDGLVYRGKRIVNWCPKHQTTLSDVETTTEEKKDAFYYFKYGPFTIGTARPETKFGDKYVVMHPEDTRYAQYKHGDTFTAEWINGPISATVLKDEAIDMEFGTGVMTITPWHDATDFSLAQKYDLPREQIIDLRGRLLPIAGEFAGMKIAEARPLIVEKLRAKGLLEIIEENYVHNVPCCYKCNTVIEPQILDQWFVKMAPLAERALAAVDAGKIKFVPDNYEKIFRYWMSNTIDWNISRQIVWGIPVPAKICTSCDHAFPDTENTATACPKCAGSLRAETDTFDTWFSSGQWPLLSLGYSTGTDWKKFHPTDVMETGHDLIFKWVPRMVIFSLYLQNEVPFHTVYLHGLVNDAQGRKMSKSKGNVINPIDIIEKYGTDALRMALVVGNTPGTDMALAEPKIKGYKNFANKIWNIARFVKTYAGESELNESEITAEADKALIEEFKTIARDVTGDFDNYRFHLASEKMYHYAWHRFADQILEESKAIINGTDAAAKSSRLHALLWILKNILIVLHPFMPFVTEELWAIMGYNKSNLLIVEPWPIED
jgi:valyl-tRNA synthetase